MKQFRFAFLIMSSDHDSSKDRRLIETPECKSVIVGVKDMEDACIQAKRLIDSDEIDKIELCGAFQEKGAENISKYIENRVPVGYVVNL
ncbi:MAG: DUF6506 family protein [Ruminococcus sp.]|jgi:hypothetical protein